MYILYNISSVNYKIILIKDYCFLIIILNNNKFKNAQYSNIRH